MSSKLSIEEMLAQLEKREVFHGEWEAFHGQQQVHHREQRAVHTAELVKVRENLATFRAAATAAADLVGPVEPPAPPPAAPKLPPPGKKFVSGLLRLVIVSPELNEPFGPAAVAAECNRRFRAHLKERVDTRTASDVLRRLEKEGVIDHAAHRARAARRPSRSRPEHRGSLPLSEPARRDWQESVELTI